MGIIAETEFDFNLVTIPVYYLLEPIEYFGNDHVTVLNISFENEIEYYFKYICTNILACPYQYCQLYNSSLVCLENCSNCSIMETCALDEDLITWSCVIMPIVLYSAISVAL